MRFGPLLLLACGSRTTLGVDDGPTVPPDGAAPPPASDAGAGDATAEKDRTAPNEEDAQVECSTPSVRVLFGGTKQVCKMQFSWSCGSTEFEINLGCGESAPQGFGGACQENGVRTASWNDPTSAGCSCSDAMKTLQLAAAKCGYPIGEGAPQ